MAFIFTLSPSYCQESSGGMLIEINIPACSLTVYKNDSVIAEYSVAVGSPGTPTPLGKYYIAEKSMDPTWYPMPEPVTKIDENGKEYTVMEQPEPVPPGPDNPLGKYWMGLDRNELGIHSTNNPSSIGYSVSHGCIRMHPYDVPELFNMVQIGDRVDIVYKTTIIDVEPYSGTLFLTAYADIYGKGLESYEEIETRLKKTGIPYDRELTRKVLNEMTGQKIRVSPPYEFTLNGEKYPVKTIYEKNEFYISQKDWNTYSENKIEWKTDTGEAYIEGKKLDSAMYQERNYVNGKELAKILDMEYIVDRESRTIDLYSVLMNFNDNPLRENGRLIKGKPYIAIKTFFNELGLSFQWNNETKEATFGDNKFKCILQSGKAFIPVETLSENFTLQVKPIQKRVLNLYYPTFSLNGININKKAFLYHGDIYVSLRELSNVTGINFEWNSKEKTALIGGKTISGKDFGGTAYLPLSSIYKLALVDINRPSETLIDINFTKIIINNKFSSVQGYINGTNKEVMLLLNDIIPALEMNFNYSPENKTVQLDSIIIPAFPREEGIYVTLTDLHKFNGIEIDYKPGDKVINLSLKEPQKPQEENAVNENGE